MLAKFNPTGTHVHKGFLKVRIDLYPDIGDKTYEIHHVQVPVYPPEGYQGKVDKEGSPIDQADYDKWEDSLPKILQLNPALCHFIKIKETSTKAALTDYLEQIFNPTLIKTLDDSLILSNSIHLISPLMRDRAAITTEKIITKDIEDLVLSVNARFASLVLQKEPDDEGLSIAPRSIDIGAGTDNYDGNTNAASTVIDRTNPANASGIIDVFELWFLGNGIDIKAGAFYGTAPNFTPRDFETVGSFPGGSKQTFSGLDCNVETGDVIGIGGGAGLIEKHASGGLGVYYKSGNQFSAGLQTYTLLDSNAKIAAYGTGGVISFLAGVTKDKDGNVKATCECFLCKDNGDDTATFVAYTQSDGSGNYSFTGLVGVDAQYFVISWRDDTPHIFDVTDHVLQPVEA